MGNASSIHPEPPTTTPVVPTKKGYRDFNDWVVKKNTKKEKKEYVWVD
jgi:hypothetical protein